MVNGPQDGTLPRDAIDWRLHEENVRRLRQRIFKAAKDGSLATVRDLQKLMLQSWSSTLVSVRQATQLNAGRKTAGAGGEIALASRARTELAERVHRDASAWRPRPVRRVYLPKAGNRAKLRPSGIPVIMDRCHQARVRNALEPERDPGSSPSRMGSGRAEAAMMQSRRSSRPAVPRKPGGYGRRTRIWRRHSTRSITVGYSKQSERFPPGT